MASNMQIASPRGLLRGAGRRLLRPQFTQALAIVAFCSLIPLANAADTPSTNSSSTNTTSNSTTTSRYYRNDTEILQAVRESIHCYALPYGAIGCTSHVLTYYCLVMNALGRKPLQPWKPHEFGWFNLILGLGQLIGSCIASGLAISRCKGTKELQLLGIWMILTSIAAGFASMLGSGRWVYWGKHGKKQQEDEQRYPFTTTDSTAHLTSASSTPGAFQMKTFQPSPYAPMYPQTYPYQHGTYQQLEVPPTPYGQPGSPYLQEEEAKPKKRACCFCITFEPRRFLDGGNTWGQRITWGLIAAIWLAGCGMGAYGSVLVALTTFHLEGLGHIWKITIGFFALPLFYVFVAVMGIFDATSRKKIRECMSMIRFAFKLCLFFLVTMLIYMDWLLAGVTNNWWGLPTALEKDGQILYWVYFGIKRLAFLSS